MIDRHPCTHAKASFISQVFEWMKVAQSCPTLCNPMGYSPPGFFVCGDSPGKNIGVGCRFLLQGIFPNQDRTHVSHIAGRFFTVWANREAHKCLVFVKRQRKEHKLVYWVDVTWTQFLLNTGWVKEAKMFDLSEMTVIIPPVLHWIVVKIRWHNTHIIDVWINAIDIFSFPSDEFYTNPILGEATSSLKSYNSTASLEKLLHSKQW